MADLLGGKGANLAEMTRLGLPVPPGFTVTTDACREYLSTGEEPGEPAAQVAHALVELERRTGRELGCRDNPPAAGTVHLGALPLTDSPVGHFLDTGDRDGALADAVARTLEHADSVRRLGVRANADTPEDAARADCPIGTMIELPRAALTAGRIAEAADFFSFGTNDLTRTAWGLSRDDARSPTGSPRDGAATRPRPVQRSHGDDLLRTGLPRGDGPGR